MSGIDAIILGVVEGLTEFLPISSTGHMILVSHFLNIPQDVSLITFEIAVQVGAILAVIVTFYEKLFQLETLKKLCVAFIPTGIIGVLVFPYIQNLLTSPFLVVCMLILGGIIILFLEHRYEEQTKRGDIIEIFNISYKQAFILGVLQSLAIIPGVSRSGAMIMGGLVMRLSRTMVTQFTFLLAVPTMLIATSYTLIKKHELLSFQDISLIGIGSITAFLVALVVIRVFLHYIRRHTFVIFGWYRIVIGLVLLIFIL